MRTKLFVEGGGDSKTLKIACRKGFRRFIENAGLSGRMPRIVACGGRDSAYRSFKTEYISGDSRALLLVDAEGPVKTSDLWQHLFIRDGWSRPSGVPKGRYHLMVEVMETWFLADRDALSAFYGHGFRSNALPSNQRIEQIAKQEVLNGLKNATRDTKRGRYDKGAHSFEILEKLDPEKVQNASRHASRFIDSL